jgi:hypothetical protein
MSKKTTESLGIPRGFRLTNSSKNNIIKSAVLMKFGDRVIELAKIEGMLMKNIGHEMCPPKVRTKIIKAFSQWSTNFNIENILFETKKGIKITPKFAIGNTSFYHGSDKEDLSGIIGSTIFGDYISDVNDALKLGIKSEPRSEYDSLSTRWLQEYSEISMPVIFKEYNIAKNAYDMISDETKSQLKNHLALCKMLIKEVDTFEDTLSSIIIQYSSAIKFVTDIPESIEWINKAYSYNKQGYKCSDVNLHDSIQELKNM